MSTDGQTRSQRTGLLVRGTLDRSGLWVQEKPSFSLQGGVRLGEGVQGSLPPPTS